MNIWSFEQSFKCCSMFQIHSGFLIRLLLSFANQKIWRFFGLVMLSISCLCLKSVTMSVLSYPGSSLPISSTVPSTSIYRPHGAPGGSLADRTSKPEHSDRVADGLNRLKRRQVWYSVVILCWFGQPDWNSPSKWMRRSRWWDLNVWCALKKCLSIFQKFVLCYPQEKIASVTRYRRLPFF